MFRSALWVFRDGFLLVKLALLEIGRVKHSRWLTTTTRILYYVFKTWFTRQNFENLVTVYKCIIGVYYPC